MLNQRDDMIIVDVGANIGITVNHFRKHAKKLYAIEPSPEHFAALKMNKEYNHWDNVEIFNYALAAKDGEMEFTQNSLNRTMNTLVVGDKKAEGDDKYILKSGVDEIVGDIGAAGYDSKLIVPTKNIETFFKENNITHVDFMKFDPEGAEDMIIRSGGFARVAPMIDTIEIEMHFPTWPQLVSYMESFGYRARRYQASAVIILFTR